MDRNKAQEANIPRVFMVGMEWNPAWSQEVALSHNAEERARQRLGCEGSKDDVREAVVGLLEQAVYANIQNAKSGEPSRAWKVGSVVGDGMDDVECWVIVNQANNVDECPESKALIIPTILCKDLGVGITGGGGNMGAKVKKHKPGADRGRMSKKEFRQRLNRGDY